MDLRQPLWMIAVGHLLGVAGIITGISLVALGLVAWQWLLLWPFGHLVGSLMTTVGVHRYFSHGAFKTNKFWHRFMAWYSVLLLNGSALGWSTAHVTHHIHSDTERDPHYMRWDYLIWKRYNPVQMSKRRLRRIVSDPDCQFTHRYGQALWIAFVLLLAAVSWKFLLFYYLMGLGSVHLIGGIHQVTSHKDGTPRDLPLLEFILPACGEWNHGTHHKRAGAKDFRTAWWHLDLGYLFIKMIETKKGAK